MPPLPATGSLTLGPHDISVTIFCITKQIVGRRSFCYTMNFQFGNFYSKLCRNTKFTQRIVERSLFIGRFLAAADNQGTRYTILAGRELLAIAARNNHRTGRNITFVGLRLGLRDINDMRRTGNHRIRAEYRLAADMCPFDNNRARTDETVVLDDHRSSLHRLQDTSDAHTSRKMNMFTDLCTRADRCPCIDHRAGIDIRADIT